MSGVYMVCVLCGMYMVCVYVECLVSADEWYVLVVFE